MRLLTVTEWRQAELDQIDGRHWDRVSLERAFPEWCVWEGRDSNGDGPLRWWAMRRRGRGADNAISAETLREVAEELHKVDTPTPRPDLIGRGRERL
ncbi:hypothetical protein [Herbidospora mongoliensis]|uniref:hypothetical protein n=1 Tax=Herbidospora mongoliensis TaxID=688067 RepID=UPI000B293523|nr:hypothetical protein [Herbidospora mongoliensis]